MMQIKESFRKYLEEAIGCDNALVAFSAFDEPAKVSVRQNPFKNGRAPEGSQVPWNPYGRLLAERPVFTLDPHFHGGAYYVQDSSSMFVGHVFRSLLDRIPESSDGVVKVLDLCAAPGGKTTDLAASLREAFGDRFILVSNEVMKQRAGVLADNVALWGDPDVVVTSDDPRAFASLPGFFDVVVADVPCSGEGMFRKDEEAQRQWSEDNVALCQARQRRIIADMWPCLKQDGLLIYSTCTFNRLENDDNVEWIAEELGAEPVKPEGDGMPGVIVTRNGYSLVPGHVEGEGQYCAALRKTSPVEFRGYEPARQKREKPGKKSVQTVPAGVGRLFSVPVEFRQKGETVIAVPSLIAAQVACLESSLHVLAAGCAAGMLKGPALVPDADLALSLIYESGSYPVADVDLHTALAFLHKDAILLPDCEKGYVLIRHEGIPLGFVKNLGNRCNNLHPQGRRIRMNIDV
ncbi:MAG: rRNA cytosine-C5-methyltransferase [Bacteroidales bacterium]|nr:rRNA cytosine-C5-methyltransferase [Bacteroidales bacterium]